MCCFRPQDTAPQAVEVVETEVKPRIKNMYMCSSSDEMLTEDELWNEDILEPSTSIPVESQSLHATILWPTFI